VTTILDLFANGQLVILPPTVCYLSDLAGFRGKNDLYSRRQPPPLNLLHDHVPASVALSRQTHCDHTQTTSLESFS